MQVHRLPLVPLESIVRGYLTGSAWAEYLRSGTVHGIPLPKGMKESQKLETPLWTPSTKAEQGEHDENISPQKASEIVGEDVARRVAEVSLKVYEMVCNLSILPTIPPTAEHRLFISFSKLVLTLSGTRLRSPSRHTYRRHQIRVRPRTHDEVLTPDSSRFWPADSYQIGQGQASYDKQFLRDWLTKEGLKGKEGVTMPEDVVKGTVAKYREAYEKLTGRKWS